MGSVTTIKQFRRHMLQGIAIVLAVPGAIAAPMGLIFTTCIRVTASPPTSSLRLWNSDYCSEAVAIFLLLTIVELFYIGILTDYRIIPRWIGMTGLCIIGAIALTYLMVIATVYY